MAARSPKRLTRVLLLQSLDRVLRQVSAQSVLMSDTVARHVGLNSTDLECLDLLFLAGPTTAGQLAAHSGLTTGATTAVIDRLERARFVRRLRDPQDRRRVLVEVLPRSLDHIAPLYGPLSAATERMHEQFGDRQLATVVDYLSRALDLVAGHVAWLQTQPPVTRRTSPPRHHRQARRRRAPLAEAARS